MNIQTLDLNLDSKLAGDPLQQKKLRSQTQHKKKLRILSGDNKGAIVNLDQGIYELGSSEACELIIDDPQVIDHHLLLEIDSSKITVAPLETDMFINGKRYIDRQTINFFDVVMIGTTSFCLGPLNKAWPKIKKFKKVVIDNVEDNEDFVDPLQAETPAANDIDQDSFEFFQQQKKLQAIKTNRFIFPIILFFGLILTIFSFGVLLPVQAVSKLATPEENINRLIDKENLKHSIVLQNNMNSGLELSGYVTNSQSFQKLKLSVLNKYPDVKIRVWTVSELLLQTKKVLQSLGAGHVDVDMIETGQLAIKGYVTEESDWEHIKRVLAHDIPSVITIDDQHLYSLGRITELLNQHISKESLDQWITVDSQTETIKVIGVLPKEQHDRWEQILEDFKKQMKFSVDIDDQVIDAKKQKIILPIKSVSIGEVSYLTLRDNSRYIEGAVILDGFVLQAIHLDHIVLSKNNIKYDYYINSEYE